ncbi:14913_t:CDS:2 [Entrophospora sp. SA101]|nr:14913_t:CDS:2 [Entrophospora sp. SA101]CAJ0837755.1 10028_t:CDS:2 [Entrophospora sp. SA101]CAJ0840450.1 19074_t:CDS:2 [Entrophospora sp. SA101]CAJ0911430.1 11011_t:CDS:2 [Entrophospora sp. SA101]
MIEQLKNFIRHGKQAKQTPFQENPKPLNPEENFRENPEVKSRVDDATVAMIVAEEKEEKNKIPTYPGLERYIFLEKMGDGAFSNVYKVLDTSEKKKVAIKVVRKRELNHSQEKHLHRDMKKKPRAIERANILKEVQIMRQLKHPSIVSLLSFSESTDYYYLVMELMEGGELFHQIVKLTYFSETLARHVIVQVAEGIRYLHEEKENLLFDSIPIIPSKNPPPPNPYDEYKEDEGEFISGVGGGGIGRVKIADFGLSKIVWDEQTKTPCGTVGYTAPEIVKDERYSKSVDIWALGCVLYTLLCGFPPFYDESIDDLTEKVAKGEYTFLSPWWDNISDSSKDLVSNLLAVDPEKRYTINQFFAHPWVKDEPFQPRKNSAKDKRIVRFMEKDNRQQKLKLDSPLIYEEVLGTPGEIIRRKDVLSPGISLKEAFDVGFTIHRMEEESARKRKLKAMKPNNAFSTFTAKLNPYTTDSDDESETASSPEKLSVIGSKNTTASTTSSTTSGNKATTKQPVKMKTGTGVGFSQSLGTNKHAKETSRRKAFELNMEGATLLGRRRKALEAGGI